VNNLLLNGSFEDGEGYSPAYWSPNEVGSGADFVWDSTHSYQGNRSVKISSATPNDARWFQVVSVQPDTDYRLSGWIKTGNVAHTSETMDAGANLSVDLGIRTAALIGTNEWTNVSMTLNSGPASQIAIAARLGYWSGMTTGTAWFDELRLEPLTPSLPLTNTAFFASHKQIAGVRMGSNWKILSPPGHKADLAVPVKAELFVKRVSLAAVGAGQQHYLVAAGGPGGL
jgi:hypothetical protein